MRCTDTTPCKKNVSRVLPCDAPHCTDTIPRKAVTEGILDCQDQELLLDITLNVQSQCGGVASQGKEYLEDPAQLPRASGREEIAAVATTEDEAEKKV